MEIFFFFLLEFFFAICNSVPKKNLYTLFQYGWKLYTTSMAGSSSFFWKEVITAEDFLLLLWQLCDGSLSTLWSANASRSLLIIAKTALQQRVWSLHLTAERNITFPEFVTLHAVYYTLSQAKFLCSSMNYNSCLFPKSQCTLILFLTEQSEKAAPSTKATGRDRVRCGRAALCSFRYVQLKFCDLDLKGNILPSSHDLTSFTLPLSHEADVPLLASAK